MLRRCSPLGLLTLCCLWFGAIAPADTVNAQYEQAEPAGEDIYRLREQLIVDGEDGQLDNFTFLQGVLIASGVQEAAALQRYVEIYEEHRRQALCEVKGLPPAERSAGLFDYLHDRLLTGRYIAERTELDQTLADGSYNCVTATVLYCELCRAAGLSAQPVAAPGHIFAQVTTAAEPTAVETTCGGWFSLLNDEARQQALNQRRSQQTGKERVLSECELIAKIFYNRGVFHLERDRYAEAIAMIRLSLRLDPHDAAAQTNLLAAFNNWALLECEQKRWSEAIRLIEVGLRLDPDYEALQANELHAYHGLASELCAAGEYAEAISLLERGYRRRPQAALFDQGRFTVYRSWVLALIHQGRRAEAQRVLAHAQQLDPRRAAELRHNLGA